MSTRRSGRKKLIPVRARSHHHSPTMHPTHFRSHYPFAFRHPARGGSHVRVPLHSRVRLPRHKSRVHQPGNRITQDMKTTTASRWLPYGWLSQPLSGRTCRALRVTPSSYLCGRQHPQASTAPNPVSPASGRSYGQATTNVRGHRPQLRQRWLGSLTVSYGSLTATRRTTAHPSGDCLGLLSSPSSQQSYGILTWSTQR